MPVDFIATELININNEGSFLSYEQASKMNLKDFLYIIRAKKSHTQKLNEKMEELNGKQ